MNKEKIEDKIKDLLIKSEMNIKPDRDSLFQVLDKISDTDVTEMKNIRYYYCKVSNIISNNFTQFMHNWKTKRVVLIPSVVLILIIATFALSSRVPFATSAEKLVEKNDAILFSDLDTYEEEYEITSDVFEDPAIDELSAIQDEEY